MNHEGHFVSLADRNILSQSLWEGSSFQEIDLGDLPCRLQASDLTLLLQKLWAASQEDCELRVRIPHPRHDIFLRDLGYVRGLIPETFAELDLRLSQTGLAKQLGVFFELQQTSLQLDPHWQRSVDEGKISYEEIGVIAKQASNVIEWIVLVMKVRKNLWMQAPQTQLDEKMRKQLEEQMQNLLARGEKESAKVIENYLSGFARG